MGNDNFHNKNRSKKYELRSSTWLICTEGKETEANYIKNLLDKINESLQKEQKIKYDIKGLGMNTLSLVKRAEYLNDKVIDEVSKSNISYSKVFVVFDKDSFKSNDFNKAVYLCEQKGYIACYSNECFEYFILEHFIDCKSYLNRKILYDKLNEIFKEKYNIDYEKNLTNLFDLVNSGNNVNLAYKRTKKGYLEQIEKIKNPSKMQPVSTMFKIFDEITQRQEERNLKNWDKLI